MTTGTGERRSRKSRTKFDFVFAAISPRHGLVHYTTHTYAETKSGVTAKMFTSFLQELCALSLIQTRSFFLVMDNAGIHKAELINDLLDSLEASTPPAHAFRHFLLFLPPYSCRLNPIENVFGIWKRDALKTRMDMKQALIDQIKLGAARITSALCASCYAHSLAHFPAIAEMKDLI